MRCGGMGVKRGIVEMRKEWCWEGCVDGLGDANLRWECLGIEWWGVMRVWKRYVVGL